MGTWSIKPFGNDTALDWLNNLQNSANGNSCISSAIDSILNDYDGCSTKAEEAMAAISIVSVATLDPIKGANPDVKVWIGERGFVPSYELIDNAMAALERIITNSELLDLWKEANSSETWLKDSIKIKSILASSKTHELPQRIPKRRALPRSLYKLVEYYQNNPDQKVRIKIFEKIMALRDVNIGNKETDFQLPLTLASKYGLFDETRYLLEKGADPNTTEALGGSPFSYACVMGHLDIADCLIEAGAEIFDETVLDQNTGYSYNPELSEDKKEKSKLVTIEYCVALFSVAYKGEPKAIDYLISKGASIYQIDLNGETLIHKASESGNIASLKHLIKLGVNVNASKGAINGNNDSRGETALHYAVSKRFPEVVKLLLENGANPNIVEYFHGQTHSWENTPLDFIKDEDDSEIYHLLIKYDGLLAKDLENET